MSEKLDTKCDKCSHKAGSHNLKTGKHECLVYGCTCGWFKIPKEKIDDDRAREDMPEPQTDSASGREAALVQ